MLEAAEAAADAGSWVAGYVGYEAASAFDPALAAGRHPGRDELPLAWFAVFDDIDAARPLERDAGGARRYRVGPWCADCDADSHRHQVACVRARIAAGDTYQTNLTARLHSSIEGDALSFYRDLALAQGSEHCAYLDTGRYVVASASPELFFEWRDGTDHDAADEGHRAAGAVGRGGPSLLRRAGHVGEGPGRERDDRRPAAQRHRADRRVGVGARREPLRPRALRDPLAADVDHLGIAASGHASRRRVRRAVPERLGHRRAQAQHHGADRDIGALAARRLLRCRRSARATRSGLPRPIQRGDPHGRHRPPHRGRRLRRGGRDHLGLGPRRRVRGAVGEDGDPLGTGRGVPADRDDGL